MSRWSLLGRIVGTVLAGNALQFATVGSVRGDEPIGPVVEVAEPLAECLRRVVDSSERWREHYGVSEGMGYYEQAHNHARAGWPLTLGANAVTRYEPGRGLYEVGGDSPQPPRMFTWRQRGEFDGLPHPLPGTVGHDFLGVHLPRKVTLFSSWGVRFKGGYGAYQTDGPAIPDILALKPFRREKLESQEEGHAWVAFPRPHGHNEAWGWSAVRPR
ncbi:hypothetical protein [Isosphaera pallida]|uniref:hypothetical protein n=1 Tax=Isosphaera pallida TaxID=128 RepID=UPI0005C610A4|nr:hypothetical protein [Isosphaera pallida]